MVIFPISLDITHLWDGSPANPDEIATIRLLPTTEELILEVEAPFHGDPPPPGSPGSMESLWNFEVVEFFLVQASSLEEHCTPLYTEVELSPHGHHLVLRLEGVRKPMERIEFLDYRSTQRGDRWQGRARLPWSLLPSGPYRGNAFAIHGVGNRRRYLAHEPVPGERPDFHRLEGFPVLDLAPQNPRK